MHRYLLFAAFSITVGYLFVAPDVQPAMTSAHVILQVDSVMTPTTSGL